MRVWVFATVALSVISFNLNADTTLYACTIDGKTTLQSAPPEKCDKLTTYEYPTYNKTAPETKDEKTNDAVQKTSGLRPEELRQLQELSPVPYGPYSQVKRYENVDDRVGFAQLNNYFDSRVDKCASYNRQLQDATFYIATQNSMDIEIGPSMSAELQAQINQSLPLVNYYCH